MPLTVADITDTTKEGAGAFDTLMRSVSSHLDAEFKQHRIKGPEYSQVYLGAMQAVLGQSIGFLLNKDKADLEAALIAKQIEKLDAEILVTNSEKLRIEADTLRLNQQAANLLLEAALIPKQEILLDKQALNLAAETSFTVQREANLLAEFANIPKQGLLLDSQKLKVDQDTAIGTQQAANLLLEAANIPIQGQVLTAQKCKLDAEFDVLQEQKLKVIGDTALVGQKKVSEAANTSGLGVDADSLIGKQKNLFQQQADGFVRQAEARAASMMIDAWKVQRSTNDLIVPNTANRLQDADIGRVVDKLITGVNA